MNQVRQLQECAKWLIIASIALSVVLLTSVIGHYCFGLSKYPVPGIRLPPGTLISPIL